MDAVSRVAVKLDELIVLGGLSADARAGNDGGARLEIGCEVELGIGDGLSRGDQSELREAIHDSLLRGLEVLRGIEVLDLSAVVEAKARWIDESDGADPGDAGGEIGPEFGNARTEGRDDSETCDRDATHEVKPPGTRA